MSTATLPQTPDTPAGPPDGEPTHNPTTSADVLPGEAGFREAAEDEYRQLVFSVASGTEYTVEKVRSICFATGHTVLQFDRHVALMRKRIEAAAEVAKTPELDQAIADAIAEAKRIGDLDRELARRIEELRAEAKVVERLLAAEAAEKSAREARNEVNRSVQFLLRTADDTGEERIRELSAGLIRLHNERSNHQERKAKLAELEEKYADHHGRLQSLVSEDSSEYRDLAQQVQRHEAMLQNLRRQVESDEASPETEATLRARIDQLQNGKLDPRNMVFDPPEE